MIDIPYVTEIVVGFLSAATTALTIWIRKKKSSDELLKKELTRNGGSSLVDKVNRSVQLLEEMAIQLHRIETWKSTWMELSDEPIYITDQEGNCIWVNNAYATVAGSTTETLLGVGWLKILHPDDVDNVFQEWERAVKTLSRFVLKFRIVNEQTKKIVTVRSEAKPLKDPKGKLAGYLGIWHIMDTPTQ